MSQLFGSSQVPGELHIRPVIDTNSDQLGWAVCVVMECGTSNTTDKQQDARVPQAELLILRQCATKDDAFIVEQGFRKFLREENVLANLAFPREFWEWNAAKQAV